jgi:hypothetical protein
MMRRCAGFNANETRRQRLEKRQHLSSANLSPDHHTASGIDAVNLKYVLR